MARRHRSDALVALFASAALVASPACGRAPLTAPPEVTSEAEEDASDLVFWLEAHVQSADGGQTLSLSGLVDGKPVAFELALGPWFENGPGFVNLVTWQCDALLKSRGAESDALLAFLDSHYATKLTPRSMADEVEVMVVAPWGDPGRFEKEPVRLLLVISPDGDGRNDAEFFLDVDAKAHRVVWKEKEPRFRRALVQLLAERE